VRHRKLGTAQDKRKDGRYAGRVRLAVAADRSAKSLCGFVNGAVAPGTLVVTDDWSGYASLRKRGYDHHAVAECGDPEVTEEFLPIIHLVFANLKTWLIGIHHGVSAQHLLYHKLRFGGGRRRQADAAFAYARQTPPAFLAADAAIPNPTLRPLTKNPLQ
jgi:ISXO2-like transposase domain